MMKTVPVRVGHVVTITRAENKTDREIKAVRKN